MVQNQVFGNGRFEEGVMVFIFKARFRGQCVSSSRQTFPSFFMTL